LASTTQVPVAINVNVTGLRPVVAVHMLVEPDESVTPNPEVAVAVAVYPTPPTDALPGAVEVMLIV
jgi:hypothetical protein